MMLWYWMMVAVAAGVFIGVGLVVTIGVPLACGVTG